MLLVQIGDEYYNMAQVVRIWKERNESHQEVMHLMFASETSFKNPQSREVVLSVSQTQQLERRLSGLQGNIPNVGF